ncbi:MAG TPA: MaoC family dehydratase [Patescibacteria group bacterium]
MADSNIRHHIEACGDDNSVHLNDSLARALPLKNRLLGRIAHGKLVQAIAIDLLRREELELRPEIVPMIVEENWKHRAPLYPGEEIRVRYTRPDNLRLNRPITFEITVFVLRAEVEVVVQVGTVIAFPTQIVES